MSGPSVRWRGGVAVVDLGDGENRFARGFLDALDGALDAVLANAESDALVTTASGRFYCNGYDLDWLGRQPIGDRRAFIRDYQRLLARVVAFPLFTVAALPGHAFGAGALLALAHDERVLADRRADFCLPEIDARIPLRRGMWALLETRLARVSLRDVVLTGARLGGDAARAAGLADEVVPDAGALDRAVARAGARGGKDRRAVGALKSDLYRSVCDALTR